MSLASRKDLPKVIDLFSGAGGLSLGASRAGFDVVSAVEIDKFALETHRRNFPNTRHLDMDISSLAGENLLAESGIMKGELVGLIGGPPCQGFSVIGQKRPDDERNSLYGHFFRLVKETRPVFFLAENVPGILAENYNLLRNEAFSKVKKNYVLLPPLKVKASDFGAPTSRTRVFFVGYDPRRVSKSLGFSDSKGGFSGTLEPVYVRRALEGLPCDIDPQWQTEEQGIREVVKPRIVLPGSFEEALSANIPQGVGDPAVLEKYDTWNLVYGSLGTIHSASVWARYDALKPGQTDPISRSQRLNPDGFCPTLRAGTGCDKGSYQAVRPIHFHFPRVITPREGARLQGFPDWFVFHPTKWHSFRQIGNSVCPMLAEYILKEILKIL